MRPLLAALLLLVPVAPAAAQMTATDDLPPGTRVRVWTEGGGKATGGIQRVSPDTLVLVPAGMTGSVIVPRASITRLDVSTGRASRGRSAIKWGTRGFLAGAVFFGVLCASDPACEEELEGGPVESALGVGLYAGAGLGVWGAVLGAIFPGEGWKRISPPAQAFVGPGRSGGVAAGVAVRI